MIANIVFLILLGIVAIVGHETAIALQVGMETTSSDDRLVAAKVGLYAIFCVIPTAVMIIVWLFFV